MPNQGSNIRKDDPKGTMEQAASQAKDKVEGIGAAVVDKGKEAAAQVSRTAGDLASNVGQKAEDAAAAVGSGLKTLAGTIREHVGQEGVLGGAGTHVAHTLEQGGRYLQEEGFSGMIDDLAGVIRRNPVPAVLVGFGLGFLLAKTTSRS